MALIIEDVHWIDKATEEVVAALVEAMAAERLLVMLVYRPEYLARVDEQGLSHADSAEPVPSASRAEMVRAILDKPYASRLPLRPLESDREYGAGAGAAGDGGGAAGAGAS